MELFNDKKPLLIAHRGYTPIAPENSLLSFMEAAKRKYWAIETDVHSTKDGVLVCCHDSSLLEEYGVDVCIEETTFDELKEYRIIKRKSADQCPEYMYRIPLFDEYLEICKENGCVPFIESKGKCVPEILKAVEKVSMINYSVLSSCSFGDIVTARSLSNIFVHHIFSDYDKMLEISKMGNGGLSYNYPNLNDVPKGLIEETHNLGVKVCLRAGDNQETVARMIAMGLDYIPTNCVVPGTII